MDSGDSVDDVQYLQSDDLDKYLVRGAQRKDIRFDRGISTKMNNLKCLVSSKALRRGVHEWEVTVVMSDVEIQEIGVVGTANMQRVTLSVNGIMDAHGLGTRVVYGSEMGTGKVYFATVGGKTNNNRKVYRDLTESHQIGWVNKDVIRVRVNLQKWSIRFWLNGNKVGKQMHLKRDKAYYPVIAFAGLCQYKVK